MRLFRSAVRSSIEGDGVAKGATGSRRGATRSVPFKRGGDGTVRFVGAGVVRFANAVGAVVRNDVGVDVRNDVGVDVRNDVGADVRFANAVGAVVLFANAVGAVVRIRNDVGAVVRFANGAGDAVRFAAGADAPFVVDGSSERGAGRRAISDSSTKRLRAIRSPARYAT